MRYTHKYTKVAERVDTNANSAPQIALDDLDIVILSQQLDVERT
jgi:hypothetical protein